MPRPADDGLGRGFGVRALPGHDHRKRIVIRERVRIDVGERDGRLAVEQRAQRSAICGGEPLLRHDDAEPIREPMCELDEIDVQIGAAVIAGERAQGALGLGRELLLPNVRRIADHRVDARPVERERIADAQIERFTGQRLELRARGCDRGGIEIRADHTLRDVPLRIATTVRGREKVHDLDEERAFADREIADSQRFDLGGDLPATSGSSAIRTICSVTLDGV